MLDGILFEKVGVPAASIVTDVFEATGHAMAQAWGVPEYKFLAMPHPIANLTEAQLTEAGAPRLVSTSAQHVLEEFIRRNQNVKRQVEGRITYI